MLLTHRIELPAAYRPAIRYYVTLVVLGFSFCLFGENAPADALPGEWQAEYRSGVSAMRYYADAGTRSAENVTKTKISESQASEIALKKIPGEVTGVAIEKKRGKNVYVIEIIAKDGGKETDVFVDMENGKVLGTD